MKILAVVFCYLALMNQANAGWSCTMPNGSTVFRQLSQCPSDAVHKEQRETALPNPVTKFKRYPPESIAIEPALKNQNLQSNTAADVDLPTQPAARSEIKMNDINVGVAAVCLLLRLQGATTCQGHQNIFSESYIDATVTVTPTTANWVCLGMANQTRKPGTAFYGKGWKLKLFSPYGDGSRPIAVCTL